MKRISTAPAILCASLLATLPAQLSSQMLTGNVKRSDGSPVAAAVVMAYSARGDTTPPMLTGTNGRFVMRVPTSRQYTIYVRSIGLKPTRVELPLVRAGRDSTIDIQMEPLVITLSSVVGNVPSPGFDLSAGSECREGNTGIEKVRDIWTEVTNNLVTSRVVSTVIRREFDWRMFNSSTDARTAETKSAYHSDTSALTTRPFRSVGAHELKRRGYMISDGRGQIYRAPDETVLLDATFIDSHCFSPVRRTGGGDGLIGLHFAPIARSTRNDIRGTFWLDSATSNLSSFEFSYSQVITPKERKTFPQEPDSVSSSISPAFHIPGGELRFRRLPDGSVIIDSWRLWFTDNWLPTNVRGTERIPRPNFIFEAGGTIRRIGEAREP